MSIGKKPKQTVFQPPERWGALPWPEQCVCGHCAFVSFWRLGLWRSCPGCGDSLCACAAELWKKSVFSQAAISNLLHHWHANPGSSLCRNVHKHSHLDFIRVTKTMKDSKRRFHILCPLCCLPFCFFHRTELVGLTNSVRPGYGDFI